MPPLSLPAARTLYAQALADAKAERYLPARDKLRSLTEALPGQPEPWSQLGDVERILGYPQQALAAFERAMALKPDDLAILGSLAGMRARTGDTEGALQLHDKRIALAPASPAPLADKAVMLQNEGAFAAADKLFARFVRKWPHEAEIYRIWFATRKATGRKDPVVRLAESVWKTPKLSKPGRMNLGFALAKAREDIGAHDEVFAFLNKANALQRAMHGYDRSARDRLVEQHLAVAPEHVARRGTSDAAPVFVTGMPRSGTTLVERVLSAHSQVAAGGELRLARLYTYATLGAIQAQPPLADIETNTLDLAADRIWSAFQASVGQQTPRITDKSILNYLCIGPLAAMFPKAHFVIVRRDPRDVALSIYKNHFRRGTHTYACDLGDIAHQMRGFEAAVAHWRDRVQVTEVAYEDLTADPEGESRRLIDALGLPWEPGCLDFHTQRSTVRTLSLAQVRQPIYQSSRGGWRKYEKELAPFMAAWEGMQ